MKTRLPLLAFALLAATLALTACGGPEAPTPTNTPEPPADSAAITGPTSLDLSAPQAFQEIPGDYTLRLEFSFVGTGDDGSDASGRMFMEAANRADPVAYSMQITAEGAADLGGVDAVEMVQLDESLYFYNEVNGCLTLPADAEEESLFNNLVDTGGFLAGTAQRSLPDETINGVPAYHFALGPENLDASDPDSMEVSELSSGSVYVAQDGGYVLRLVLEGTGVSELLSGDPALEGDIFYQLDFEPAPGGVTVSAPAGCDEEEAASTDYPVLDDAINTASFGTFYNYETNYDFDYVVNFYKTELAAAGWTLADEISAGGTAALQFQMGDRNLSVVVAPVSGEEGAFSVVIAEE
jgi:hypothetical protein